MTLPRILLCKASAGSGKTFTLAKSFIRILLERPHEYDRILAVTFTNKATEEMKSRILKFLTEISRIRTEEDFQKSVIAQVLLSELPGWDYQRLSAEASKALSNILHDYGHFAVMTLDSFFQKMIRAFIIELKLPNAANPSLDINEALDSAVAALMDDYDKAEDKSLNKWLRDIALSLLEDGKKWQPADMVRSLSRQLFNERISQINIDYPIDKVAPLYQELKEMVFQFKADLKELCGEALDLIDAHGMMQGVFSRNSLPNQLQKMYLSPVANLFSDTVLKAINEEAAPFPKAVEKQAGFPAFASAWLQDIRPACEAILHFFETRERSYRTALAILKHLQSLALLSEVSEKIKEYRTQEGVMLISDNSELIQQIITYSDTPFLYEKLGNRYRYILLDEFQDTSTLQWNNLLPLITEILAHRDQCQILIVGDAKQSIYRWRNGNLKLILSEVKATLHQHWQDDSEITLERNFRSLQDIVRFNNDLFPGLANVCTDYLLTEYSIDPEVDTYCNLLRQLFNPHDTIQDPAGKEGGFVEGHFFPNSGKQQNSATEDDNEDSKEEEDERTACMHAILQELLQKHGYSFGDITILVRSNKEAVHWAGILSNQWGFPVLTADALLFSHHPVIQVLLAALRVLSQPGTRLYQAELVHRLIILKDLPGCTMDEDAIGEWMQVQVPALALLSEIRKLQALSLSDLLHELLGILQLQDHRSIYTEQFLDVIASFQSAASGTSIGDFLEWWAAKERSVTLSGEADAIQIVTVHKSKGLEFNVVIIPSLDWSIVEKNEVKQALLWATAPAEEPFNLFETYPVSFNSTAGSHFEDVRKEEAVLQAADNLNLLYVAFTRPVERLYFMAKVAKDEGNRYKNYGTIGKLLYAQLATHQPENFEGLIYHRGQAHPKRSAAHKNKSGMTTVEISLEAMPSQSLPPLAYSPQFASKETKLGEAIHDVAAQFVPQSNLSLLARRALLRMGLGEDLLPDLEQRLRRFFADPNVEAIYQSEQLYPERSLVHKGETLRLDLLVKQGNDWKLYDFKTGARQEKNVRQMQHYREALAAAGISVAEAALIYIDSGGTPAFEYV
jgi:ATP-dependent helicase/nuclease subunit A